MAPIAVIQGVDGAEIQHLLAQVATAPWRPARIAGVVEEPAVGENEACGTELLRNLADGDRYAIFQNLGPGSTACALDPGAVAQAAAAVCRDIAAGCDLVLLSKFGKLEAESGSGLFAAFVAAMEAEVPILTTVSPRNSERWHAFAAPYYTVLDPSLDEIADWWATQRSAAASSASR